MEQTIENIWKQGFVNEELTLPHKINNVYSKRSNLILDKLRRTLKWDNLSLIPIALVFLGYFWSVDKLLLGSYGVVLISALFLVNRKHLKQLMNIKEYSNCYDYLSALQKGIQNTMKFYNRLLAVAAPIAFSVGVWLYFKDEKPLEEILIIAVIVAAVMPLGSILVYRLSTKVLYGQVLSDLEKTIEEIKELQN